MPFEFTPEQRADLRQHPGETRHVEDHELHKLFMVIEQGVLPTIDEAYVRTKLMEADAAVGRQDVGAWDASLVKAEGRRRLQASGRP
jgi:hypothetical protein